MHFMLMHFLLIVNKNDAIFVELLHQPNLAGDEPSFNL